MQIEYTAEEKGLQQELRDYFDRMMTPELVAEIRGSEGGGPRYREAMIQMGRDGWLGIGWPKEYGGQGRSWMAQYIFVDEVQRAGFPLPFLTLGTVGPTIMRYGTEAQKKRFLSSILRGELFFAIGYSEPEAGTDLAALRTRAVRDGDDWLINGQKVFTSLADFSDYVWLACRTDPDAPKHRGISLIAVPTDSPGFSITPTMTVGGVRTNTTYYENVRVSADNLIGGENNGWSLITSQLNHERISLVAPGPVMRLFEGVVEWAHETLRSDGSRVIDEPWVRSGFARVNAKLHALELMQWKQVWTMAQGNVNMAESSAVKVFGSELFVEAYEFMMEVMGQAGYVKGGSPGAVLQGRIEMMYRTTLILCFGGGTNEVQRDIIAMAGLQMPHYK